MWVQQRGQPLEEERLEPQRQEERLEPQRELRRETPSELQRERGQQQG
jgi:hypothetical protein